MKHLGQDVSDAVGEEAVLGLQGLGQAPAELPVEHSTVNCPQTSVMVTGNASKMITSCGLEMKEIIPTGSNSFVVNREKKSFPYSIRRDAENQDSLVPLADKSYGGAAGARTYHRLFCQNHPRCEEERRICRFPCGCVETVKLFIGNLPREATEQEIRSLFQQYGKVLECDIIKNYGFVHIEDKTAAEDAIHNLHRYKLHEVNINVEASKNKSKASTKLHVGNINPTCTNQELRTKFEEYGPVIECDIVKDYAFVHMERAEDAVEAIRGLDNTEFQGKRMHVQLSTSRLRTAPGMGDQRGCYRCGKEGHWSKECPVDRSGRVADLTEQYNEQYGAVRTPYTMSYGDSLYYNNTYGALDAYYKRCRAARSYEAVAAAAASAYNYAEQTLSQLPQVQNTAMTSHLTSTSLDPYNRHLLPPSGAAAAAAAACTAASTSYYGRDRSPLRCATGPVPTVGEGYGYGHDSELSQASAAMRNSLYDVARYEREQYVDRARYSAF
ncbi:RNA-binding protein 4-like [Chionomys nivalis]|uniref:RNA-binding protein 4-like n=1 Tax=Chionomys nivalis TaxID=269649 RepID=UPI0025988DF8|nr:RNA-binding protein 4-like [Chionomys nivalis]